MQGKRTMFWTQQTWREQGPLQSCHEIVKNSPGSRLPTCQGEEGRPCPRHPVSLALSGPRGRREDARLYLSPLSREDLWTFFAFSFTEEDVENFDVTNLSQDMLRSIEADSFWCMSKLLDGIQVSWFCPCGSPGFTGLPVGLWVPYYSSASDSPPPSHDTSPCCPSIFASFISLKLSKSSGLATPGVSMLPWLWHQSTLLPSTVHLGHVVCPCRGQLC